MKRIFAALVTFIFVVASYAQTNSYYHDLTLDAIANNVAYLDEDYNYWMSRQTNAANSSNTNIGLTIQQLDTNVTWSGDLLAALMRSPTNYARITTSNGISLDLTSNYAASAATSNFFNSASNNYISSYAQSNGLGIVEATAQNNLNLISFGDGIHNVDMGLASWFAPYLSAFLTVRNIIMSLIWLGYYVFCLQYLYDLYSGVLTQRQIEGSNQSVLGTNMKQATGALTAIILTATIATTVGVVVNTVFFKQAGTASALASGSLGNLTNAMTSLPAWDILTALLPINGMIIAFTSYIAFRYFYGAALFFGVRVLVWYFIA